jgi:argininosuccinate lyase
VALAERRRVPIPELSIVEVRRLHRGFGADWAKVFDLKRAFAKRRGTGMPGPTQLARQFARWRKLLG